MKALPVPRTIMLRIALSMTNVGVRIMPGRSLPTARLVAVRPSKTAAIGASGDVPIAKVNGAGGFEPNASPSVIQCPGDTAA